MAITLESGIAVGIVKNAWPKVTIATRISGGNWPKNAAEIPVIELDFTGYPAVHADLLDMFVAGARIELRAALFVGKNGYTPAEAHKFTAESPLKIVLKEYYERKRTRAPAEVTPDRVVAKLGERGTVEEQEAEIERAVALLQEKLRNKRALRELNNAIK